MKTLLRACTVIILLAVTIGILGSCVYSQQKYGAIRNVGITPGKTTMSEVVKQLGAPSFVGKSGSDNIIAFSGIDSFQVLGVYASVIKQDLIVITDGNGIVKEYTTVDKGEGMSILGPFMAPSFEVE